MSILTLSILLGCGGTRSDQSNSSSLRVQILPLLSYAPYFIAVEEGYFEDEGVDVELVNFQRSVEALPLLARGDIDVYSGSLKIGLLNLMAKTPEVKIVAGKGHLSASGCSHMRMIVRKDFEERNKTGSVVSVSHVRTSISDMTFQKSVVDVDCLKAELIKKPLPVSATVGPFEQGELDIVLASEPWATYLLATGEAKVWFELGGRFPNLQSGVLVFGPTMYEEHKAAAKPFIKAYLRAVHQYNLGKTARNKEIILKYTNLDSAILEQACWPEFKNDGSVKVESIELFENWASESGYLDYEPGSVEYFDDQFVRPYSKQDD